MELEFALALAAVLVAGGIQRITGMGFALCATPLLVIVYGPLDGVRVVVLLGLVLSLIMLVIQWRAVDVRTAWRLSWPGVAVSPFGALAAVLLPEAALLLLVGAAAVASLVAGRSRRLASLISGRGASIKAGAAAGFLNLTSGLSGPPLVGYAEATRMPVTVFVATVQVVFVVLDGITLAWRGLPTLPIADVVGLGAVMLAGLALGSALARAVPERLGRRLMLAIAWIGTFAVLVKGVFSLVS